MHQHRAGQAQTPLGQSRFVRSPHGAWVSREKIPGGVQEFVWFAWPGEVIWRVTSLWRLY